MKARQLEKLGIPSDLAKWAKWLAPELRKQRDLTPQQVKDLLADVARHPQRYRDDDLLHELAAALDRRAQSQAAAKQGFEEKDPPAPWTQWGDDLDANSIEQLQRAVRLPVAVRGALMPDAHLGYGLPIGGVLATDNAVIPYAVGVDIACRMKLTVLDIPPHQLVGEQERFIKAIETETRFGMGASFVERGRGTPREHPVLDEDWDVSPVTRSNKDKAHAQLGTSGSGNHFVEFGELTIEDEHACAIGLETGETYLGLLSHSGSRGPGAKVASYYSNLAMDLHPELPKPLRHLAWLDLDSHEGQEYWEAMQLMGQFAAANHAMIHHHIARHLGASALADVENHHNFAWIESHDGRDVVVHRKGATPAGEGVLGIIPGSMASPGFIVRGKGNAASLRSAAHGAGRVMSRTKAKQTYRWNTVRDLLQDRGVTLISAGLDEAPFVYKDIEQVMAAQQDLVEPLARFDPKLVKMAPEGERPED